LEKGLIRTKSIYDKGSAEDGLRVLVTRYWPRGVRKGLVDKWLKGLGTPVELIKAWKAGGMGWDEFASTYSSYLGSVEGRAALDELRTIMKGEKKSVTLLCTCKAGNKCHSLLLKRALEGKKG
jgi:uncharacterized protein YeaO (DUF488 family)